jgi:hypothetical protein
MTAEIPLLSKIFNALIPNTVNKSPRAIVFEHGRPVILKGPRPLDVALQNHDKAEAERLLKKGANPNLCSHFSGPALNEAVKTGDIALVKLIVENGGNVNGVNTANTTALHTAISELRHVRVAEQKEIMEYLLEKGARLDTKNSCDMTPLEWAKQLGDAQSESILAKASGVDLLDELKPFLQQDGSYQFNVTLERMPKSIKIDVPDFRDFYFYANIDDGKIDLKPVGAQISRKVSEVFGLDDARIGYRGDADNGYKMEIIPAGVWRAQEEREAEAQRIFDNLLAKGIPTAGDVQAMKPISFKPKTNP